MRRLLQLWLVALIGLTACDDFEVSSRRRARSTEAGERRIVVNGGEDDPAADLPADDGGAPSRHDGGPATLPADSGPDRQPPPPPGACGNPFETEVFDLVNQERARVGKPAYQCDPLAVQVAHAYSQLQCDLGQLGHNVGGSSPFQRMSAAGIQFWSAAENVAAGQPTPTKVMQAWMNSSGHRANILGNFSFIGVGYVPCSKGGGGWFGGGYGHYWTQNFWK